MLEEMEASQTIRVGRGKDVLFSTSLGMPIKRAKLTRPMRIMGFLRMLRMETV